jgi:hypothetical protein
MAVMLVLDTSIWKSPQYHQLGHGSRLSVKPDNDNGEGCADRDRAELR